MEKKGATFIVNSDYKGMNFNPILWWPPNSSETLWSGFAFFDIKTAKAK